MERITSRLQKWGGILSRASLVMLVMVFSFTQAGAVVFAQSATTPTAPPSQDDLRRNDGAFFAEGCGGDGTADTLGGTTTPATGSATTTTTGTATGASDYGGSFVNGAWVSSNKDQHTGVDDNGLGTDGKSLGTSLNGHPAPADAAKYASFAELDMGKSLGGLPPHAKLSISYKGKTVIAEKRDIGGGGADVTGDDPAHPGTQITVKRGIDLWWETAKLLDFKSNLDIVTYTPVPDSTPLTKLDGSTDTTPDNSACCPPTDQTGGGSLGDLTSIPGGDNEIRTFNFFVKQLIAMGQSEANAKIIASGIIGSMHSENAKFNPTEFNGQGSGAYGIAQWLGGRLSALKKREGTKYNTLEGQWDYLWWEITKGPQVVWKTLPTITKLPSGTPEEQARYVAKEWEATFERSGGALVGARMDNAVQVLHNPKMGGAPVSAATGTSSTAGQGDIGSCSCAGSNGITIVLDPGHVTTSNPKVETVDGISAQDSGGAPGEEHAMWLTAMDVFKQLKQAGYHVIMTKGGENPTAASESQNVGLIERAQVANNAHADLAVSMHYDDSQTWSSQAWVIPQTMKADTIGGTDRTHRTTGSHTKYFDQNPLAQQLVNKSEGYAKAIKDERTKAEGRPAVRHFLQFPTSRGLPSVGNMSIVQLFSNVPWVYNEVGARGGTFNEAKYAKGIANGIEKALPVSASQATAANNGNTGAATTADCAGGNGTGAVGKALDYAWPTHHNPPYGNHSTAEYKPAYLAAVRAAVKAGKYVGGGTTATPTAGVDCGGFVTRVMQDSGADPKYGNNGNVRGGQEPYLRSHPDKYMLLGKHHDGHIASTAELKPGDIAIEDSLSHTYMWVGTQPNFQTKVASSSYSTSGASWRTPMAGVENPLGSFHWYHPTGK